MDMRRLLNQVLGNYGKKVVHGVFVEDASETYDNHKKNKMPHLLEEEEIFVLTFDLRYKESRKSFNARAAMIQFEGPIAFRRLMITGKEKYHEYFSFTYAYRTQNS